MEIIIAVLGAGAFLLIVKGVEKGVEYWWKNRGV
jgi:hypothetical protein